MNLGDIPGSPDDPGLIFCPDIIVLDGVEDPVEINEFVVLTRAVGPLRELLKGLTDPYIRTSILIRSNPWEFGIIDGPQGSRQLEYISDVDQHRFWTVRHWRCMFDDALEKALAIAGPGLTPTISLAKALPVTSNRINRHAMINWLDENLFAEPKIIGRQEVDEISKMYIKLQDFERNAEDSDEFIKTAIEDFCSMSSISRYRPIYVVGLFAIIEKLLTTHQELDSGKSLTRQLRTKIELVANRFDVPLETGKFFPSTKQTPLSTVISKLYSYRSLVAHGSGSKITSELKILENHGAICAFLNVLVRKLLMQALVEPQLFKELKNC